MEEYAILHEKVFEEMSQENIRTYEEFNDWVDDFEREIAKVRQEFKNSRMCEEFITREQYIDLNFKSSEELMDFWSKREKGQQDKGVRLLTCNLCPLMIEEFE